MFFVYQGFSLINILVNTVESADLANVGLLRHCMLFLLRSETIPVYQSF